MSPSRSRDFKRTDRLSSAMREELTVLLRNAVRDPAVTDVTLTDVKVTMDLGHAQIYYTTYEKDAAHRAELQAGLERAAGFLRREIGRLLHIRRSPELHFVLDSSIDYAEHIEGVLRQLKTEDKNGDHD